jgi:DNA processing protein
MPPDDLRDFLALHLVPNLGPRLTEALLERFGSAAAIRRARADQLRGVPRVGDKLAQSFAEALAAADVDGELALMARHGVTAFPRGRDGYPPQLAAVPAAPPLIYCRGSLTPADAQAVAIVGTRRPTAYGQRMAERLAAGLARAGVCVVSGLARGIDGIAHRAALDAGGRTVAVLAGGLSRIYPPEHAKLADAVAARGALVTETPMRQEPLPGLFPARNRIISGLSRGVIVVEAGEKSGALITTEHAAEQGREVFAVPGPADGPESAGCLRLLRDGARLVRSADDVLEDLDGIAPLTTPPAATAPPAAPTPTLFSEPPPGLDEAHRRVWDFLSERRHADEIARGLGLPAGEVMRLLMGLEMKKAARRLPGNQYERR